MPVNDNVLLNIIKLRIAVYFQGCNANQWKSIESNDASTLLEYIFPKTGRLAYYNLILEQMRTLHREYIPAGQYFLFNMPVQFEEKMLNYLKNHPEHTMKSLVADPEAFISSWATVACDNSLSPVNVGAIKDTDMELLLRGFITRLLSRTTHIVIPISVDLWKELKGIPLSCPRAQA